MSQVAATARELAGHLLPQQRTRRPPALAAVDAALMELANLRPVDSHDEVALHEAGETLLRLRDAAAAYERPAR